MRIVSQSNLSSAHGRILAHVGQDRAWKDGYSDFARRLPGLIQVSGLIQAALFVESRRGAPERQLLKDLSYVLLDNEALLTQLKDMDAQQYRAVTARAQQALVIFKRLSASMLGDA